MSWRPIDFQGIVDLDNKVVEQLELFLQEKENRLAHHIVNTIQTLYNESIASSLTNSSLKLSDAIDLFSKKVRLFVTGQSKNQRGEDTGKQVQKEINNALWEFTEILEGCVVELFQRAHQVPINRWHLSIAQVVQSIKDILLRRIEDIMWAIKRLEKPLREFCQKFQTKTKTLFSLPLFGKTYLDQNLLRNLEKTEKFLKASEDTFHQNYNRYMTLGSKVEEYLEQMKNFPILALLEVSDQNLYVDIFRLLKMIELNRHGKKEISEEISRSLKQNFSIEHVVRVFRLYFQGIRDAFFNSSLEWKSLNQAEENFYEAQQKLKNKVKEYQQELRQYLQTLSHYRTFVLKNQTNPYIGSRWGFTEWIVGPEPPKAKKLLNMLYSAEDLDSNFTNFLESLGRDPFSQQRLENEAHQEIEKLLHEMGQPLISQSIMRNRSDRLLKQLKACDEVGSPQMSTIYYVEDILAKVMREDWKYHVLHEFPLFHKIFRLHQGLSEYIHDPSHVFRLDRFRMLFTQIREWVEQEDLYSHVHEIQLDINDMKTYLQDFLATVQRAVKDKSHDPFLDETINKFRQQLLEYRYLFGQFFHNIISKSQDGLQLRNQFLFVDQYFDAVENLLIELKASREGKI